MNVSNDGTHERKKKMWRLLITVIVIGLLLSWGLVYGYEIIGLYISEGELSVERLNNIKTLFPLMNYIATCLFSSFLYIFVSGWKRLYSCLPEERAYLFESGTKYIRYRFYGVIFGVTVLLMLYISSYINSNEVLFFFFVTPFPYIVLPFGGLLLGNILFRRSEKDTINWDNLTTG